MTSDATPDTPDPRAVANEIAMRAAGSFQKDVEPELRVSKLFALNVATEVVKALSDAGLLVLPDEGALRSQASGTPVGEP